MYCTQQTIGIPKKFLSCREHVDIVWFLEGEVGKCLWTIWLTELGA